MKCCRRFTSVKFNSTKSLPVVSGFPHNLLSDLKPPELNQILKSHLKSREPIKALLHFREARRRNPPSADSFTLLYALKASTLVPNTRQGKQLHPLIFKLGFESIIHLQTSLMRLYGTYNNLAEAHQVFDEIIERNVVSWTVLLSCYLENQRADKTLELFRKMLVDGFRPDGVTITVVLSACADRGALDMGKWIHSYMTRRHQRLDVDLSLENALIDMYAKCGHVVAARKVFDRMGKKDVTTWTSMIFGHALHGQAKEALVLFSKMKRNGDSPKGINRKRTILPNDVTFIGVLIACSHAGLVDEARLHFRSMMEDYNIEPREQHYGCLVDTLCRAGLLEDAHDLVTKMPVKANPVVWRILLGACSLRGNIKLSESVREKLLELDPCHAGDSVAMSNIYAGKEMWDEKIGIRNRMKEGREAGRSCIVLGRAVSGEEFVSGDNEHSFTSEIRAVLAQLADSMRELRL